MSTLILFAILSLTFSVVVADLTVDIIVLRLFHTGSSNENPSSPSHGVCGNCIAACASSSQGSSGMDGDA